MEQGGDQICAMSEFQLCAMVASPYEHDMGEFQLCAMVASPYGHDTGNLFFEIGFSCS